MNPSTSLALSTANDFLSPMGFNEYMKNPEHFDFNRMPASALLYLFLHDEPKLGVHRTVETKKEYLRDLRDFLHFATDRGGLNQITSSDVAIYQHDLSNVYKPTTMRRRITIVKQFLRYLLRKRAIENDLTKDLKQMALPANKLINRDMYEHEVNQISEYLEKNDFTMYVLFVILISTGLRIQELANATWNEVFYYPSKGIHFLNVLGKRDKTRDALLFNDTFSLLCELRRLYGLSDKLNPADNTAFFPKPQGTNYRSNSLSTRLSRTIRQSNLPFLSYRKDPITAHTCRHYTASYYTEQGVDVRSVQDMLGHSKLATTEGYLWKKRLLENHAGIQLGSNFLSSQTK
jgi:site-specific recombinase XerD